MNADRKPLLRPVLIIALIVIIIAAAFIFLRVFMPNPPRTGAKTPNPANTLAGTPVPADGSSAASGNDYSVQVALAEGQAQTPTPLVEPVATGEPLTPQEIEAIFARLPGLPASPADQSEFKYPVQLLPPPRPGKTITEQFPPLESAPTPEVAASAPLQVLRFAPQGEIPIAPFVSITFNQPMVPLGTLGDLAAEAVPVRIDPPLTGTWRWLGTKTLTFEYDSKLIDRLPKATAYTVTIPAGTKSVSGGRLAEAVTWTFSTPAPKLVAMYPQNIPQPLQPLIFAAFDQRIDPAAVLETTQVFAGNTRFDLALASQSEIEKD